MRDDASGPGQEWQIQAPGSTALRGQSGDARAPKASSAEVTADPVDAVVVPRRQRCRRDAESSDQPPNQRRKQLPGKTWNLSARHAGDNCYPKGHHTAKPRRKQLPAKCRNQSESSAESSLLLNRR
eukprot:COSAG02_NODE_3559_length_6563_cov_4.152382_12_plen_126_part_00